MVRNKEEFPSSRLAAFLAAAPPTAAAKGKRSRLTSDAASPDPVEALPAIAFPDAAVTLPQRSPRPRWIAGPLVEPEANARKPFGRSFITIWKIELGSSLYVSQHPAG